jgi:uncharacterized protein (DUF983 family)
MSSEDAPKPPAWAAAVFQREAEAEAAARKLVDESKSNLQNRCPECGALGSLETWEDGTLRCIDCDVTVGAASRLGGLGS